MKKVSCIKVGGLTCCYWGRGGMKKNEADYLVAGMLKSYVLKLCILEWEER